MRRGTGGRGGGGGVRGKGQGAICLGEMQELKERYNGTVVGVKTETISFV